MDTLVDDPRLPVVSFTGPGPVGRSIRDRVPRKHVTLEFGGNAAAVVCVDWNSTADLQGAAERIAVWGRERSQIDQGLAHPRGAVAWASSGIGQ